MKKCVILFAILLLTLIIAVWTERKQEPLPSGQIALEEGVRSGASGADVSHPQY